MSAVYISMFGLLAIYALVCFFAAYGFLRTPTPTTRGSESPKFSIIVCARNEEKHLDFCIRSIMAQTYAPEDFELLLVDDDSSDRSFQIANDVLSKSRFSYTIIRNEQHLGKKQSILKAIALAKYSLIVSRDADTFTTSKQWLQSLADHYQQHNSDFVIAPIAIANHSGLLWALQAVENNVLMLFAAGSAYFNKAFLCSGANLSYRKETFARSGAFVSHLQLASGDDVLLLEDVKKIKARVSYLKAREAIVITYPCLDMKSLLQQKIRWASKFKQNPNVFNGVLAMLVFLLNLGTLLAIVVMPFVSEKFPWLMFILLKWCIDILLLFLASTFMKNKHVLWYGIPVTLVYPVYACMVALASLVSKPQWK